MCSIWSCWRDLGEDYTYADSRERRSLKRITVDLQRREREPGTRIVKCPSRKPLAIPRGSSASQLGFSPELPPGGNARGGCRPTAPSSKAKALPGSGSNRYPSHH